MVNVNGERRRPLGVVSDLPLKIKGCIIPMDAIVTEADSYAAIVGNDWLRKTKAVLDYNNNKMTIKWDKKTIEVVTECQEMPHHIFSVEVSGLDKDEPDGNLEIEEDEAEEEADMRSDEDEGNESDEYESDENTQEQMFCHAQYITKKEALKIESDLQEQSDAIGKEFFYQYEEIEKGNFHTENLNEEQ